MSLSHKKNKTNIRFDQGFIVGETAEKFEVPRLGLSGHPQQCC